MVIKVVVVWALSLSRSGPDCIGSFCFFCFFFTDFRIDIVCG